MDGGRTRVHGPDQVVQRIATVTDLLGGKDGV